jgi:cytochrome P450
MQATEDNVLPLATPVKTRDGDLVDSLVIAKGTMVGVSVITINRSEAFWGPDARKFKPERWLNKDGLVYAKDVPGHRHLLTFSDGPTSCLGKAFLLGEFKVTCSCSHIL